MIIIEEPKPGASLDASTTMHPSKLEILSGRREIADQTSTFYGYVMSGAAQVETSGFSFRAGAGGFFCIPGEFEIEASGLVAVIARHQYRGLLTVGRMEGEGRLGYLNGCTSTVLVSPPRSGDPVLNHLHIPKGIDQTPHTHPSARIGIIVRGHGTAHGRAGNDYWRKELPEGSIFLLPPDSLHAFRTLTSEIGMDLITYHPDSDWGPTDDRHPMLTATIIPK